MRQPRRPTAIQRHGLGNQTPRGLLERFSEPQMPGISNSQFHSRTSFIESNGDIMATLWIHSAFRILRQETVSAAMQRV